MTKPNAPTPPTVPRGVWTLSPQEGVWAFAAAGTAWFALFGANGDLMSLPAWSPLLLCNTLAASAVCAVRFWRKDATRNLSPLGYFALACPVVQTFLYVFTVIGILRAEWLAGLASLSLFAVFVAHFCASAIASLFASLPAARRADNRGDLAVFPLFLAWWFLVGVLVVAANRETAPREPKPKNGPAATTATATTKR